MITFSEFKEIGVPWPLVVDAFIIIKGFHWHGSITKDLLTNYATKTDVTERLIQQEKITENRLESISEVLRNIQRDLQKMVEIQLTSKNR